MVLPATYKVFNYKCLFRIYQNQPYLAAMNLRNLFLAHVGQTSEAPLALNIVRAQGSKMWDEAGKEYIDLIAGISVCNVGHCNAEVTEAIKAQAEKFTHIMVYGELVEAPQVMYAKLLADNLPASLNSVFFTSSGSEATEGAMKLAKRHTGRTQIISFKNSYHGSTQGSLSIMGSEYWQQAYRPLLPDVLQLEYNSFSDIEKITNRTASVFVEPIQAEAGVIMPTGGWLQALKKKCNETGALLVVDEIQCGFGRNGTLWAFEQFGIVPDILLLGKALGGGMPLGAFIADKNLMMSLAHNPALGHISTFGGHPVSCAAGHAAMQVLLRDGLVQQVKAKEALFVEKLQHPKILSVNHAGLMLALHFDSFETNKKVIDELINRGVFSDWFLFASNALRIAPPLTISEEEITGACKKIMEVLNKI